MLFEVPYSLNLVVCLLRVGRLSSFRWDVVNLMSVWFRLQRPLEAAEVVVELMVVQVLRQVFGSTGVLAIGIVCCRVSFIDSHPRQHGIDDLEGFQR